MHQCEKQAIQITDETNVHCPHQKGLHDAAAQGQAPVALTGVQHVAGNTDLAEQNIPQLRMLYMLTSFAMLSQISAIGAGSTGAGSTGPGTCHSLVYST
jgi:hypothetical protein